MATMVTFTGKAPRIVAPLTKVAAAATALITLTLVAVQIVLIKQLIPPLAGFAVLGLVFAAMMLRGWRWTPLLGAALGALLLVMDREPMIAAVTNPLLSAPMFLIGAFGLLGSIGAIVMGVAATIQNYHVAAENRRAPRGLGLMITIVLALIAGAAMVAAMPAQGLQAGISQDVLDALPALTTANFAFDQSELRVKAGEIVTMKLVNTDAEGHFFDVDELNVHAPIPSGKDAVVVFKPTTPGEYLFYCHPHADKASQQGMVGKLIVE